MKIDCQCDWQLLTKSLRTPDGHQSQITLYGSVVLLKYGAKNLVELNAVITNILIT